MILSVTTENYNSLEPVGPDGHNNEAENHGNETFNSTHLHDNGTNLSGNGTNSNETYIPIYYESTTENFDDNDLIFINGNSIFINIIFFVSNIF